MAKSSTPNSGRAQSDADRELLEAIRRGPGGAASTDRAPIGVPDGYTTKQSVPSMPHANWMAPQVATKTVRQSARYFDGDELRPANWTPAQVADLQRKMAEAGLLKGKFRLGYWDGASQKAYSGLLAYANQSGRTATATLGELRTHPEVGDEGQERAPLVIKTSSPDDLRGIFRDVTRKLLGHKPDDAEINSYIAAYNQVEAERQRQMYNLEETGGSIQQIPSAEAYMEERLRKERPVDVGTHEIASRANEFYDLLGSFGGD